MVYLDGGLKTRMLFSVCLSPCLRPCCSCQRASIRHNCIRSSCTISIRTAVGSATISAAAVVAM